MRCSGCEFKHFDHHRKRLTIFTKGGKIRDLPIPQPGFWFDLERLILEEEAQPHEHLLPRQKAIPRKGEMVMHRFREQPMGVHGMHNWWYRCLRAGVVSTGITSGERMRKARHTAGQRVLDMTGNLKAPVQKLLGHESIQTTGDIYTDWDIEQLRRPCWRPSMTSDGIVPQGAPQNPCKRANHGGGGNRTRVRGRTGQGIYERSPRLISPGGRFADDQPTGQPS